MKKIDENKYVDSVLISGVENKNRRIYPLEILYDVFDKFAKRTNNQMYGELGHPSSINTDIKHASHKVNEMFFSVDKVPRKKKKKIKKLGVYKRVRGKDKVLCAQIELTTIDAGRNAKMLIDGLVASPRGIGTIKNNVVQGDYQLLAIDLIPREDDAFKDII